MKARRPVTAHKFAELLNVDRETLRAWDKSGFCRVSLEINSIDHYYSDAIDQLLADGARDFKEPPTFDDLLSGRLVLVPAQDATDLLPDTPITTNFADFAKQKRIRRILFKTKFRYVKEDVVQVNKEYAEEASYKKMLIPRQMLPHVIGPSLTTINQFHLIGPQGPMVSVTLKHDKRSMPVTRTSVEAFLRSYLLPEWIDAEDWVTDRLDSSESLLGSKDARVMLGITYEGLLSLVERQALRYVTQYNAKNTFFFDPESVRSYLELYDEPVTSEIVARLYGVHIATVNVWMRTGLIACVINNHTHAEERPWLYRSCWIAILATQLSPRLDPYRWYARHKDGGIAFVSQKTVSAQTGIPIDKLHMRARSGDIKGIFTPGGALQLNEHQFRRLKADLKKK
jgi:predicted site-specific integrase-resolvase